MRGRCESFKRKKQQQWHSDFWREKKHEEQRRKRSTMSGVTLYHLRQVKYWHNFSSIILNAAKKDTRPVCSHIHTHTYTGREKEMDGWRERERGKIVKVNTEVQWLYISYLIHSPGFPSYIFTFHIFARLSLFIFSLLAPRFHQFPQRIPFLLPLFSHLISFVSQQNGCKSAHFRNRNYDYIAKMCAVSNETNPFEFRFLCIAAACIKW